MAKIIIILIVLGALICLGYYFYPKNVNAPEEKIMNQEPIIEPETKVSEPEEPEKLVLTSQAFEHLGKIPSKYTCDGQKINPPLEISEVADNAKSLVLIMEDPDVPKTIRIDGIWDHWLKFNLPASLREIKEGIDPGGVSGLGTSKTLKYVSPCPPDREHRYFFKLYSLDTMLDLKQGAIKSQIENAMQGHILQQTELIGLYNRQ